MKRHTKPVLRGDEVVLRPLGSNDAGAIHASLDEPVLRRLTGTHAQFALADVQAHCVRIEHADDRWDYGIVVRDRLIGEVVLNDVNMKNRTASFRIAIWFPDLRNKGYGSKAAGLLIGHGFETLGLNRIELEVYAFNPHARRVYEKLGFKLEGTKREALIWEGETIDAHMMGILRGDYLSRLETPKILVP